MRLCLLLFLFGLPLAAAWAKPPCDPALSIGKGGDSYRLRAEGRCEGFYVADASPVSEFRLTGLSRGDLRIGKAPVHLRSPLAGDAIQVRGVAIPPKTYYRLDLLLPPAGEADWPALEVAGRAGLTGEGIGLFGFMADAPKVYVPVMLEKDAKIRMAVSPARRLTALYWRFGEAPDAVCQPITMDYREQTAKAGFEAGREIVVELPEPVANGLCVEMAGLTAGGDWLQGAWRIRTGD